MTAQSFDGSRCVCYRTRGRPRRGHNSTFWRYMIMICSSWQSLCSGWFTGKPVWNVLGWMQGRRRGDRKWNSMIVPRCDVSVSNASVNRHELPSSLPLSGSGQCSTSRRDRFWGKVSRMGFEECVEVHVEARRYLRCNAGSRILTAVRRKTGDYSDAWLERNFGR